MYVYVKSREGVFVIYIQPDDTVFQIKKQLCKLTGIKIRDQRVLTYTKKLEEDDLTASEYGIYDGSCLYVSHE